MPEPSGSPPFDSRHELAVIRREFAGGLDRRLETIREALGELADRFSPDLAEAFYLPAHMLKGTAAAFGADELVPHATRLAALGRAWCDGGDAPAAERRAAADELDRLAVAIRRYQARTRDGR